MEALEVRQALLAIGTVLREGERPVGSPTHWLNLSARQHAMNALAHLDRYLATSNEIDLAHAAARLVLSLERFEQERAGAMTPQDLQQLLEERRAR